MFNWLELVLPSPKFQVMDALEGVLRSTNVAVNGAQPDADGISI